MFDPKKVEDWQANPQNPSELKLKGTNHYVRIACTDANGERKGPYNICHGHVYVDGGNEIPLAELPDSFWKEVSKVNKEQLKIVGFAGIQQPALQEVE